ncbi:DUF397 domain-containing protein [Nocardia cyriacigeorgica]|uniref:DUF397 domain-containing protein n=1 Tax=Nocardia cyriacigeorgica TaxID=135487 RepID=A0A5R8PHG9_9NOCA|nr:DUF397 domain-containing protein [Nocardia cyriacigeorgica]TLG14400.1 DUF397 domain-containing protein [Nocardia cyriacigeorgica]
MNTDLSRATWFKSTHSGGQTDCVEVAWLDGGQVGVRDSKNPSGPALIFAPTQWDAFAGALRSDDLHH